MKDSKADNRTYVNNQTQLAKRSTTEGKVFCLSFDGMRNTASFYINGVFDSAITGAAGPVNNYPLYIGWDAYSGASNYFNGTIDEVRILNISLSADEILQSFIDTNNLRQVSPNDYDGAANFSSHVFDMQDGYAERLSWTEPLPYGDGIVASLCATNSTPNTHDKMRGYTCEVNL